jgi:RNA polymerase sigma factor (sigma-70 family)
VTGLPPFQHLLDAYRVDVWRFLMASVGPNEAEDCFQETFLSAMRAYPRLRPDSNLRAWILTIAHRKALDVHRARRRRPVAVAEVDTGVHEEAPGALADGDLWRAVGSLPPRQRAAVLLRCAGDLSHRQVASALGCSEDAARRSAHEGLKKLREVYAT